MTIRYCYLCSNQCLAIIIVLSIIGLSSCSEYDFDSKAGSNIQKNNLLDDLNSDFNILLNNQNDSSYLIEFYKLSGGDLLWLNKDLELNERGKKIFSLMLHSEDYGLFNNLYESIDGLDSLVGISKDTTLTSCFIDFILDLKWGLLPNHLEKSPFPSSKSDELKFLNEIAGLINDVDIDQLVLNSQPTHPQYHSLVTGLKIFNKKIKDYRKLIEVPVYKEDSILAYKKATDVLLNFGLLDSLNNNDSVILNALKIFQNQHGLTSDGIIGSNTSKALSRSPYDYFLHASVALEKWRKRLNWAKDRIDINIPGFQLRYFQEDNVVRNHRVIIGTKFNRTIEILDTVEYLVVYPYWHVPYSIISNELIPKARKDSSYFKRNGYELLSGGKIVNPELIDYDAAFKYTVRQKGGKSNALGLIKFIFPNPAYIYLHDTPSKKLFNKEVRAFSHGCIRLENPLDLAKDLLIRDDNKYDVKMVDSLIKERERTKIFLNSKLPIYIHYTLASTNNGNIIFHNDVYGEDKALLEELKKMSE